MEDELVAQAIEEQSASVGQLNVTLTNELVQLLSEQLYESPLKAVEELVVNSYDADATECRLFVPDASERSQRYMVVFDDGTGMDYEGLKNLWFIGRSIKASANARERQSPRKQIGKFGIGKLATYTIAHRLTYITRTTDKILSVTLNYNDFKESPDGANTPVVLGVKQVVDWDFSFSSTAINTMLMAAGIKPEVLIAPTTRSWTIAILEDLKPNADKIKIGRLKWVLETAMPMGNDFKVYLNGDRITSRKDVQEKVVEFSVSTLPRRRLDALTESTGEHWKVEGDRVTSEAFPEGISGSVIVTKQSLVGKSDDLQRSNGFFVRVRGRLVNQIDPFFGIDLSKSHATFNRFRADIICDDLHKVLTAPREAVANSNLKEIFQKFLQEISNEARIRYEDLELSTTKSEGGKKEEEKNYVNKRLVEFPVADVLVSQSTEGSEADNSWFYLKLDRNQDMPALISQLYSASKSSEVRKKYRYQYVQGGTTGRIVAFNPGTSTFILNEEHQLVRGYQDDGRSKALLEDIVTAEALLEVYLRESQVSPHVIGEVLERRDTLLRNLVKEHPFSLELISQTLRDAAGDEHDLEVALVTALRPLGFTAKHISNAGEPDGIARFREYPGGEKVITLEAKASGKVPSLSAIDFAGLHEHMTNYQAHGCLLLAPAYPGSTREEDSAASNRARQLKISCWTVRQLADFVAAAEARHFTAADVLTIVLSDFTPDEVTAAIARLMDRPEGDSRELYRAILDALRQLEGRLIDSPRDIGMIAGEVTRQEVFKGCSRVIIEKAITEIAAASQGALVFREGVIHALVSLPEIERRVAGLTKQSGEPVHTGNFRHNPVS